MPAKRKPTKKVAPIRKVRKTVSRKANPRYSDASFLSLVRRSFRAIGETTLIQAFTLYHMLHDKRTPASARITIIGALAYLILPFDFIPDYIPVVGFTDDMGAIAAAVGAVSSHAKADHKRKAAKQVKDLLG